MYLLRLLALSLLPATGLKLQSAEKLTTAKEVRSLNRAEAEQGKPVEITGIVIFSDPPATAFLQDKSAGTFFRLQGRSAPDAGDRVRVKGRTFPGLFLTGIEETEFEILASEPLPEPIPASYDDLLSGKFHYQRVGFKGIVRTITPEEEDVSRVTLASGSRLLEVRVQEAVSQGTPKIGSRVTVSGLAAGHINHRRQLVEPYLRCMGWSDFVVLTPAKPISKVPRVSPQELLGFDVEGRAESRVRIEGIILAVFNQRKLFLRNADAAISVMLLNPDPNLRVGQRVEVLGFPKMDQFSASLADASVLQVSSTLNEPTPVPIDLDEIFEGTFDNDLITVEGTVSDWYRLGRGGVLVLRNGEETLTANLSELPAELRAGVTAALTGITRVEASTGTEYRSRPESVSLTLRSAADFRLLRAPQWWTPQRLAIALIAFLAATLIAGLWIFLLRRQVSRQTIALRQSIQQEAALEERQRLAREFHDTLEQDLAGLSLRLDAAGAKAEDGKIREFISGSRNLVSRIQEETRSLVSDLRDSGKEFRDLNEALSGIHEEFPQSIGPSLKWELSEIGPLPSRTAHHLKMIAKEAITNAIKHAGAGTITVTTSAIEQQLTLSVCDDGCGISREADTLGKSGHFGCMGIRERARRIDAVVSWETPQSGGTCLFVKLPLNHV